MSLLNYLHEMLSIALSDEHLVVEKFRDLKKRKRVEPVALGMLFLWDLSSVKREMREDRKSLQERYDEWKRFVVGEMDGFELNVEGLTFKVSAGLLAEDDFCQMETLWKDFFVARSQGLKGSFLTKESDIFLDDVAIKVLKLGLAVDSADQKFGLGLGLVKDS